MIPYCAKLNINIHPLKNKFDPFTLPRELHQTLDLDNYLNSEISNFLSPLGVCVSFIEVFNTWLPYQGTHIHVDTMDPTTKLNWIFGGADSINEWFKISNQASGTSAVTEANTESVRYNLLEIEKILFTYPANSIPFLFNAGIAHRARIGMEKRCCISLVLRYTNKRVMFNEAVDIFSNYLIS